MVSVASAILQCHFSCQHIAGRSLTHPVWRSACSCVLLTILSCFLWIRSPTLTHCSVRYLVCQVFFGSTWLLMMIRQLWVVLCSAVFLHTDREAVYVSRATVSCNGNDLEVKEVLAILSALWMSSVSKTLKAHRGCMRLNLLCSLGFLLLPKGFCSTPMITTGSTDSWRLCRWRIMAARAHRF